jgi:hypothetical protein
MKIIGEEILDPGDFQYITQKPYTLLRLVVKN